MKKSRRILAVLIAGAMSVSCATSAFAAAPTGMPGTTTVTGTGEVSSGGTVYKVILPTANSLNFYLDPLGLAGIAEKPGASLSELEEYAGKIVSAPANLINESSVPLKVDVSLDLNGTGLTFVTDADVLEESAPGVVSTTKNVLLTTAFSKDSIGSADSAFVPGAEYVVPGNVTNSADDPKLSFVLCAADYKVTPIGGGFGFALDLIGGTGKGTQMKIGGLINRNATWTTTDTATLAATFSFSAPTTADLAAKDEDGVYGLRNNGGLTKFVGSAKPLGFAQATGTMAKNTWTAFDFNFGDNTTVTKITTKTTTGTFTLATTNARAKIADGKVELYLDAVGTHIITVTLSNVEYQFTLTVT